MTPPTRQDKTVLSRLDAVSISPRVGGMNTTAGKTRQFCLVRVGGVNKPLQFNHVEPVLKLVHLYFNACRGLVGQFTLRRIASLIVMEA